MQLETLNYSSVSFSSKKKKEKKRQSKNQSHHTVILGVAYYISRQQQTCTTFLCEKMNETLEQIPRANYEKIPSRKFAFEYLAEQSLSRGEDPE